MTTKKLPSTAVGRRRLLKLAGLLEADAKNKKGIKFDLGTWAKPASLDYGAQYASAKEATAPAYDCGTAACAVGLALVSGAFVREGLTIAAKKWSLYRTDDFIAVPKFGRLREFSAVNKFFALTKDQSGFLFQPYAYRNTKGAAAERAVAKRIRDFVAGKAAP